MGLWCIDCSTGNYNDFDIEKKVCKRCNSTNIADISGNMKVGDILTITAFSKDKKFLEAMSELYENNIIEYESKMSQFRTQVQQQENSRAQAANTVKCPRCGSTNITAGQRGFSLLTGFVGSGKTVNRCANCGHKWRPWRYICRLLMFFLFPFHPSCFSKPSTDLCDMY